MPQRQEGDAVIWSATLLRSAGAIAKPMVPTVRSREVYPHEDPLKGFFDTYTVGVEDSGECCCFQLVSRAHANSLAPPRIAEMRAMLLIRSRIEVSLNHAHQVPQMVPFACQGTLGILIRQ